MENDEIDLKELLLTLWEGRAIIVAVTLLLTVAAAAYAYLSTPVYKVEAQLVESSENSQIPLHTIITNIENSVHKGVPHTQTTRADTARVNYQEFINTANSKVEQADFFQKRPDLEHAGTISVTTDNASRTKPASASIAVSGSNAALVTQLANEYMNHALEKSANNIKNSVLDLKSSMRNNLVSQVEALKSAAQTHKKQRIAKLREALLLAESLDMEQPISNAGLIVTLTDETAYMRGSKALRNEIELLEKRSSNDEFIPELIEINQHIQLLDSINLDSANIKVAHIETPAIEPRAPVKPRKSLIIAVGLVLGGMLGVFLVLVRNMFNDQTNQAIRGA